MRLIRRVSRIAKSGVAAVALVVVVTECGCRSREPQACREYLDRLDACVARMDPTARHVVQAHLAHEREEFTRLAKSADSRAMIERECTASLQAIAGTCPP